MKKSDTPSSFFRPLSLLAILVLAVFAVKETQGMGMEDILNLLPQNSWGAAAALMLLYAAKSLTVVFPVIILQISAGYIFDPLTALAVNLGGAAVGATIPYLLGRFSGQEFVQKKLKKYPKADAVARLYKGREWFFSYIARAIGCLPMDIVSIMIGSMGLGYGKYLTGTLAGMFPGILAATVMGATVTQPGSPAFIISVAANVAITAASLLIYRKRIKK